MRMIMNVQVDARAFWRAVKARATQLARRTANERVRANELTESARRELASARQVHAEAAHAAAALAKAAVQRALESANAAHADLRKWSRVRSAMLRFAVTRRMRVRFLFRARCRVLTVCAGGPCRFCVCAVGAASQCSSQGGYRSCVRSV